MKKYLFLILSLMFGISIKAQVSFDSNEHTAITAAGASDVILTDIDEDGVNDLLTTAFNGSNEIHWYKGDGEGNFTISNKIFDLAAYSANYVLASDLNGDNHTDAVFVCTADTTIIWYANDGTGNFSVGDTIDKGNASGLVKAFIYDIDHDGDKDIAAIYDDAGSNKLVWYANNGSGTFGTENIVYDKSSDPNNSNFAPADIFITDFNSDGYGDILVADNSNTQSFEWFINNTDGTWTMGSMVFAGSHPGSVNATDIDGDGDLDIIGGLGNTSGDNIIWIENQGSATFASSSNTCMANVSSSCYITRLIIAQLNGKGNNIVGLDRFNNQMYFLTNYGNGTSFAKSSLSHTVANNVAFEDIGSDGDMDMISPSASSTIAWLNNITPIILQDPQDAQPVCEGTDSVLFTVKAINVDYYSWKENSIQATPLSDGANYHGTETDSLYVNARYASMNGYKYVCRAYSSAAGYADTSEFAFLSVDNIITAKIGTYDYDKDVKLCDQNTYTLKGNDPSPHTGYWSAKTTNVSFNNNSVYNTNANFNNGEFELYWTIDNKSCPSSTDTMKITNYHNYTANAGVDDEICDTSKYQLNANTISAPSTGKWTCNRSEVTFDDVNKADAIANNLPSGASNKSTFTWEINNGACGYSNDDVVIKNYSTIIANAGDDIKICDQTVGSLHGNDPYPYTGYWKASNANVVFGDTALYSTNLSNIPHGQTTFTWTIDIPVCGSNSDDMVLSSYASINFDLQPTDLTVTEGENANLKLKVSGDVKSYQWYKGDNIISDDTRISGSNIDSLVISNTQQSDTGSYKCVVVDYCYEQDHNSDIAHLSINASTTGLPDLQKAGILIYPNPNNGQFEIKNTGNKINQISIINMRGEIIFEQKELNNLTPINISSYPKGIYILNIDKNTQNLKYRIIVQ